MQVPRHQCVFFENFKSLYLDENLTELTQNLGIVYFSYVDHKNIKKWGVNFGLNSPLK